MDIGTLLSSQERRALPVALINRGSNADFVPPSVYIGFFQFVLAKGRSGQLSMIFWRARLGLLLGNPTGRHPGLPGLAVPRRPAVRRADPVVC